jgi:reactive intermediate/imine deaminase
MATTKAYRISTDPDPFEQFKIAQGYRVDNLIFLSGQAAIDETGAIVGINDFDAQAEQTFKNIKRVLEAAGSGLEKVIKVTIYLTDMGNFPKVLDLRERWFTRPYPADTIVEVGALGLPELLIEIEAIALARGEIIG